MIHEFYAVTRTSMYHIRDKDTDGHPSATKIALRGKSPFPKGYKLRNGTMIAICQFLVMYVPEGGGQASLERRLEKIDIRCWGDNTSFIVALFSTEAAARVCFDSPSLKPCDPRWFEETTEVLTEIGIDHPVFEVCRADGLSLFPAVPQPS